MALDRRLVFVALEVADLDASLFFYRDVLGLPLQPRTVDVRAGEWLSGPHLTLSWFEGAYLQLTIVAASDPGRATRSARLGFGVDDLEAVHAAALAAGVDAVDPPRDTPWGRAARYRDPDGNLVTASQVSEENRPSRRWLHQPAGENERVATLEREIVACEELVAVLRQKNDPALIGLLEDIEVRTEHTRSLAAALLQSDA